MIKTFSVLNIDRVHNIGTPMSARAPVTTVGGKQLDYKWNLLLQEEFDQFPLVLWFEVQGSVILNNPQLTLHLKA